MSYVKYAEDISDELFERDSKSSDFKPKQNKQVYYDCKYCGEVFNEKHLLFNHIKAIHNIVRPIITINEKIIGEDVVIQFVDSAKIELYGFNEIITINDNPINILSFNETYDFTKELKEAISKNNTVVLGFLNATIEIEYNPIHIHDNKALQKAIRSWEDSVKENAPLSTEFVENSVGGDKIFLTGLYNYYLACNANHNKSQRYDDAWAYLSKFNEPNGLEKCVLKTIAFRRNWIERLKTLNYDTNDDFQYATDFFDCKPSYFTIRDSKLSNELFIEESTSNVLNAILLFQHKEYKKTQDIISLFGDLDLISDENLVDKLLFINSRLALLKKNITKASEFCERIITPNLKESLRKFIAINKKQENSYDE